MDKHCPTCGETKPLADFFVSNRRKDGRSALCKVCSMAATRASKQKKPEQYKQQWLNYASRFPERLRANNLINNEVKANRLPPASKFKCANCDKQAQHYHHPDYNKPMEVIPLCESCHRTTHALQKADTGNYGE